MSETEHDPAAARDYERTLRAVADRQAVDEAESILALAWIAELEDMRRTALRLAAAARLAVNAARVELRDAQTLGRPTGLAQAHARLTTIAAEQQAKIDRARALLASVDCELEAICHAGIERSQRCQEDLRRLRTARTAVFGARDAEDRSE